MGAARRGGAIPSGATMQQQPQIQTLPEVEQQAELSSAVVALDDDALAQVSGGFGPNGGWACLFAGPNGGW
jgi:hypothetical protein